MKTSTTTHRCLKGGHSARGYATLSISVILLIVLILSTLYGTRSGIIDIRTSANKSRQTTALALAERRLNAGLAWMMDSTQRATLLVASATTWSDCDTVTTPGIAAIGNNWLCTQKSLTYTLPDGTAVTDEFHISTPKTTSAKDSVYFVLASNFSSGSNSDDNTALAVVKQGLYFYNCCAGYSSTPPLMGTGNVPLNGTFSVVANPNGGGRGVPVSIWSKDTIDTPSGSAATCQLQEYSIYGDCSQSPLTSSSGKGADIVDGPGSGFPDDVFNYVFGIDQSQYGVLYQNSVQLTNCNNLAATVSGLINAGTPTINTVFWVKGNCSIPAGTTIGSSSFPVTLVVQPDTTNSLNGDFTMNANSTFFGRVFAFSPDGNAGDIQVNGGATFYGSMISNDTTTMGLNINGTFNMIFSDFSSAIGGTTAPQKIIARIPGSWADYLN